MHYHYSMRRLGRSNRTANQTDPLLWTVIQYMNLRAQPPRTAGVCLVGTHLLLGLLPCMTLAAPPLASEIHWPSHSRPYLAVLGASPLRIQEIPPPPDLTVHPPAGAPPQPAPLAAKTSDVIPPSPEVAATADGTTPAATPNQASPPPTESTPAPAADARPSKPVKSILPDDTRPKVRAEDFLPFFQPPGANPNPNDVTVAPTPPAPGIQPPSSATYRQQ